MPSRTEVRSLAFTAILTYLVCYPPVASLVYAQDSLLPTLQRLRAEYPTPMSREQIGELLTRTAQSAPGWVLLRKPTGTNCPAVNTLVACDYLVFALTGQGFDVLQDQEGLGVPTWNSGDDFQPDRYVMVPTSSLPPDPDPGLPPLSSGDVDALVELLAEHDLATRAGIDSLRAQIAALKFPEAPTPAPTPVPDAPAYFKKGRTWWFDMPALVASAYAIYQQMQGEAK